MLQPYGSLFYAAVKTFEENFPAADEAKEAVVIFVLRGYDDFGSTMIGVMDRYVQTIMQNGGIVKLAGVSEAVLAQLERTGLVTLLGRENIYVAQRQWGAAATKAYDDAQFWLEEKKRSREIREKHQVLFEGFKLHYLHHLKEAGFYFTPVEENTI